LFLQKYLDNSLKIALYNFSIEFPNTEMSSKTKELKDMDRNECFFNTFKNGYDLDFKWSLLT
jgi:hypothetical protein